MRTLDETHNAALESWVESANRPGADFPIQNLPFCVFRREGGARRIGVGIGDRILDLTTAPLDLPAECFEPSLNALMGLGSSTAASIRLQSSRLLRAGSARQPRECLHPISECELLVPAAIANYTDFYASIFHARNVGEMFRPASPLPLNYKYVPLGYHGRASSIVASGTRIRRPAGQVPGDDGVPVFGPSRQVDYECELGAFVAQGNALGEPIPIDRAEDHLFGVCLLNDWSARDIQRWEGQPLGPFLSKNFATSVSPWVVTMEALAPFRAPRFKRPEGDPATLPYLDSIGDRDHGGIAITVEVWIGGTRLTSGNFAAMYWTLAQLLTHHASNGCNLLPGDLIGSGTISGPEKRSRGCLLELTWKGTEPFALLTGESRTFLEDGDEVILRGYAQAPGFRGIGLGECRGTLVS